jgi:hypothetical protein
MDEHLERIRQIGHFGFMEYERGREVGGQRDRPVRAVHLGCVTGIPQLEDQARFTLGIRGGTEDGCGGKQGVRAQESVPGTQGRMRTALHHDRGTHAVADVVPGE